MNNQKELGIFEDGEHFNEENVDKRESWRDVV